MIVFDLACTAGGHRFEAWFASSLSYDEQREKGLIACPICGDTAVAKAVMAPNVGSKGNRLSLPAAGDRGAVDLSVSMPDAGTNMPAEIIGKVMAHIAAVQAEALPRSRWVGRDFDAAARAMHEGRAKADLIHGQVSPQEAEALHEDGIAALPLLVPFVPPDLAN